MMRNWKKTAVAALAALTLTGIAAVPAMAHGHGHHNSYCQTQDYGNTCYYHGRNCDGDCGANRSANCGRNCQKQGAASTGYYCEYHDKTHKKKSACSNYCKKHKTIHANGKRHRVSRRSAS